MKYLVTISNFSARKPLPPKEEAAFIEEAKVWGEERRTDGTVDCSYYFLDSDNGFAIMNASSHEELFQILQTSTFHQQVTWEAKPIIDAFQMVDADLAAAKEKME
ncbi:MAG: hypothetical protein HN390_10940 [Anaerolineae bacterium]|nr:hypothetical protein [Anaerolineae bacterium]MBT7989079.1 hypothetical protein [Anaerolineae bacterium]